MAQEEFAVTLEWPAAAGQKMPPEAGFSRDLRLGAADHAEIAGGLPRAFGGAGDRYNPEELLLLALSECHMLTYLALAEKNKLQLRRYRDRATGRLGVGANGRKQIVEVVLHPQVTLARGADVATARALHEPAHKHCFIANSVNFPVLHESEIVEE